MDKLRSQPLWFWGMLCFVGAAGSVVFASPPHNASEALGAGTARLIFCLVGLTLIVLHFVRSRNPSR